MNSDEISSLPETPSPLSAIENLTSYQTIDLLLKYGVPAVGLLLVLVVVIVALWQGDVTVNRRKYLITFSLCAGVLMLVGRLIQAIPVPGARTGPVTIELVMEPSPDGNPLIKELITLKVRHNKVTEPFTNGIVKLDVNPGDGLTVNVERLLGHFQQFQALGVQPSNP